MFTRLHQLWRRVGESGNFYYTDPSDKRRNVVINKTIALFLLLLIYALGFSVFQIVRAVLVGQAVAAVQYIYPVCIFLQVVILSVLLVVRTRAKRSRVRTSATVLVYYASILYITTFSAFLGREVGFWLFLLMLVPASFVFFPYHNKLGIVLCQTGILIGLIVSLYMQYAYPAGLLPLPEEIAVRVYYQKFFVFFIGVMLSSYYLWKQTALTEETLLRISATDALTGILNRRRFQEIAHIEFQKAWRYRRPLALIIFDLDYFKRVNDDFGHAAGDEVLRTLANLVQSHIRPSDYLARWGGEEFLLLLTETNQEAALATANKLKTLLEEHIFDFGRAVTASFGLTDMDEKESFEQTLARADRALYAAKHAGRNRIMSE